MAATHHEKSSVLRWDQLSEEDRKRLMDSMGAAVGVIPDELALKSGTFTAHVKTGEARDTILGDYDQSKQSVLYGR